MQCLREINYNVTFQKYSELICYKNRFVFTPITEKLIRFTFLYDYFIYENVDVFMGFVYYVSLAIPHFLSLVNNTFNINL